MQLSGKFIDAALTNPRRSAAAIRVRDSLAAVAGVAAMANTARASGLVRCPFLPANALRKPAKYSRSSDRSSLDARVRRHVAS